MVEFLIDLSQSPLSLAMATSSWVVPTMQSIHIISIAVIFVSVLVTALRVIGVTWGGVSVRNTVDRFAPWAWTALAVLAVTGIVLILAEPLREILALSLWLKMILLVIAITISVRFLRAVRRNEAFAAVDGPVDPALRRNAIITIAIWVAIIFLGRFIAYDPLVWGSLSPIGSV
jgi:putative copper export protein